MTEGISETVSNNQTKRKRGRPATLPDWDYQFVKTAYPDVRSRRQQQNLVYRLRASGLVDDGTDRFRWLVDPEKVRAGEKKCYKGSHNHWNRNVR
jgi:hypothetical protein